MTFSSQKNFFLLPTELFFDMLPPTKILLRLAWWHHQKFISQFLSTSFDHISGTEWDINMLQRPIFFFHYVEFTIEL